MSGKVSLTVPIDITDEQLVEVLKEVLPGIIARLPSTNPLHQQVVPELAEAIVYYARQCSQSPQLRDIAFRLQAQGPTPEQCQIFESAVEELIELRFGDTKQARHQLPMWRLVVGKIWARLYPVDKEWEREQRHPRPSAAGPRG